MQRREPTIWTNAFLSMIFPLAIGLAMYVTIDLLIDREVIDNELVLRYLIGHPISRFILFLFCVGVASLLVIANNIFDQFCSTGKIKLVAPANEIKSPSDATDLPDIEGRAEAYLKQLSELRWTIQGHYLWGRLNSVLNFISRSASANGVEEELKYLGELDAEKQQNRYSLIRIIIWATPMLGFLGTVLGISEALGGIQVGDDNDFQGMLNSLRSSLYVAFDTTALALALSMLLMFCLFFIERFESHLLDVVSRRTQQEITPLLKESISDNRDVQAVEKIGRTLLATSHNLVKQQAEQWSVSMKSAERSWLNSYEKISASIESNLSESLRLANVELADSISRNIEKADQAMSKRWEQWQVSISENARQLSENQRLSAEQIEKIEILVNRIENAKESQQLLNRNLDALFATSQLHETLAELNKSLSRLENDPLRSSEGAQPLKIHRPVNNSELDAVRDLYRARRKQSKAA